MSNKFNSHILSMHHYTMHHCMCVNFVDGLCQKGACVLEGFGTSGGFDRVCVRCWSGYGLSVNTSHYIGNALKH